ncbi:hypothetical protein Tco_0807955 [Tanacetum coccineum]
MIGRMFGSEFITIVEPGAKLVNGMNLPLQLEKRVYPPSGSQTVDLVLNHMKYKVLVGNVPLENSRNILEMYFYRDEWWNMMEELDFQPVAVTASETYSSYVFRSTFFYLGRKPAEYNVQRWFCNWRGHASHGREDITFYQKLTTETLTKGLIVIPSDIVKTYKLYGYASAIVTNRDAQYVSHLAKAETRGATAHSTSHKI